ncbi:MAG: ERF family protein [bacterium]
MNDKLLAIQQGLKAPKNKNNDFAHFKYRSCEAILLAVKPLLAEQGLTLTLSDAVVNIGNANYVMATAKISNGDDFRKTFGYAREAIEKKGMDVAQITGSASSYARKYALAGLFAIDDSDDIDAQDNTYKTPTISKPVDKTLNQLKIEIMKALNNVGITGDNISLAISQIIEKPTVNTIAEANEILQAIADGIL